MSEKLRRYTKAVYGFDAVVRRVPEDRWASPSPCPDWTATDVVRHQVDVHTAIATMAGGTPLEVPEDAVAAWAVTLDHVLTTLDTDGALHREDETPFGHMSVDQLIGILFVDPLTHTWDLSVAAGLAPMLDAELCRKGANQLERAGDFIRSPGLYGDAVAYAHDAGHVTRFVAVTGRDPAAG